MTQNPYDGSPFPPYQPPSSPAGEPSYDAPPPGPPPPPYGAPHPYGGAPNPYGAPSGRGTDGISIAALVCSLTCCAAPIGVGLGIAGLVRTSNGARSGRWAAVTGLVVGIVAIVAGLGFFGFAVYMGSNTLWEDEARPGQCLDVDFLGDPAKAVCADPHDGEVIASGRFDDDEVEAFEAGAEEFCSALPGLEQRYRAALESDDYDVRVEVDSFDEEDPSAGDHYFCWIERADGGRLTGGIGEAGGASA